MKTSVVAWLSMVRIGRMTTGGLSPAVAARRSTTKTESPSPFRFTSSLGVVRASSSMRSECSARLVQTFWPWTR